MNLISAIKTPLRGYTAFGKLQSKTLCLLETLVPLTWNDLTVSFEHLNRAKLVEDWQWLVGAALPILITSVGDVFLQNESGEVFWLITGSAEFEKVADSFEEFQRKLRDKELIDEWFLVPVVVQLKEQGILLEQGKLYGFKQLPVLGGKYEPDNFELTDIGVHFAMSGQMNFQIKDLPDGTQVIFSVTE
ncbi:T6SS immunity protein Tdi1 domain-containing protein [Arsukibacterium sp.]|uniref:T6SS immunity protein Tdi1 domain-containing protein n=1 Tax=Arsukibacterium sp. TaxID=1977258 RepID=UPI001BD4CDF8|nr:T6SS immunity protein Tdi1 domain-containing protein [Arsukibacterium sp.]